MGTPACNRFRTRRRRLRDVSTKETAHMYQASQVAELLLIVGFAVCRLKSRSALTPRMVCERRIIVGKAQILRKQRACASLGGWPVASIHLIADKVCSQKRPIAPILSPKQLPNGPGLCRFP